MKYSTNGFWIEKIEDTYRIGLSEKGQDDLGDIGFVELLISEKLSVTEAFIGVEAAKAVTELEAPINGTVIAVHEELINQPELLNSSNKEDNWIVVVNKVSSKEYDTLADTSGL